MQKRPTGIDGGNNPELEDQFKKLGFLNFEDILETAYPLSGFARTEETNGSISPAQTFHLDDINPRRTIDYSFTVERSGKGQHWQILSIAAFAVIDTVRNDRGFMLVQKIFQSSDGPLPDKTQMEKEVIEMIKIEEAIEKLHVHRRDDQNKPRFRHKM